MTQRNQSKTTSLQGSLGECKKRTEMRDYSCLRCVLRCGVQDRFLEGVLPTMRPFIVRDHKQGSARYAQPSVIARVDANQQLKL